MTNAHSISEPSQEYSVEKHLPKDDERLLPSNNSSLPPITRKTKLMIFTLIAILFFLSLHWVYYNNPDISRGTVTAGAILALLMLALLFSALYRLPKYQ